MNLGHHILNETTGRLESTSTECSFCRGGDASQKSMHYYKALFREQKRTNVIVYRNVKFAKIAVGIPRCKKCKEVHESANSFTMIMILASTVIFFVIGFVIFPLLGFVTGFLGFLFPFAFREKIEDLRAEQAIHTLTKTEGVKKDPLITDMRLNGWTLNQPMA